jgi:hypothetical protein
MTRRSASRDTTDLQMILDASGSSDSPVSGADVNRATAERMFNSVKRAKESLSARFVGGTADDHELSARSATKALLALQESVSSIGAKLSGLASVQGKLPNAILSATELRFAPTVLPGSVIFELSRPTGAENMLAEHQDRALLDESFDKLFELVAAVVASGSTPDTVPTAVRALGPRAAKHIFDLCAILVDESLGVDLRWVNRAGDTKKADLTNGAAHYLKRVAENNRSVTNEREFVGTLLTASVESKQNLRVRITGGDVLSMTASPTLRTTLAAHYNKTVKVRVDQTETANLSTGKMTVKNTLRSIESTGLAQDE